MHFTLTPKFGATINLRNLHRKLRSNCRLIAHLIDKIALSQNRQSKQKQSKNVFLLRKSKRSKINHSETLSSVCVCVCFSL